MQARDVAHGCHDCKIVANPVRNGSFVCFFFFLVKKLSYMTWQRHVTVN